MNYNGITITEDDLTNAVFNASLIAEAPELLSALEMVVAHGGVLTGGDWETIHKAITKAKGGAL